MSVAERIRADMTAAMKAGRRDRASALRMVLSELQKSAKAGGEDEISVLRRERKRRRDAEQVYREAGRSELAEQEAAEAQLIEVYLPGELSDEELDAMVRQAIADTGAQGPREMGAVMKQVMADAGGRADGRRVSAKVREALAV